jgi:hypothetical protein
VIDNTLTTCKKQELQTLKKRMHQLKKTKQKNIIDDIFNLKNLYLMALREQKKNPTCCPLRGF